MAIIAAIRKLYRPIQPTVKASAPDVMYREMMPAVHLQPYIYCYWELKTLYPLCEPYNYQVVADGCMDVFFDMCHPQDSFVAGFSKQYSEFPLGHQFHYAGIRFLPGMFTLLFGIPAAELSHRLEGLDLVVPTLSCYIDSRFHPHLQASDIKSNFDSFFELFLSRQERDPEPRLFRAVEVILKSAGSLAVQKDLDTGISPRHLRRMFETHIGDSPKTFSKIVRFQHIVHQQSFNGGHYDDKFFFDAGYYDQAHFIREFKQFYGSTPAVVLK